MGISGVPLTTTSSEIKEALKKHNGIVSRAARELHLHISTLYRAFEADSDLKKYRDDIRIDYEESQLDEAEETLIYALSIRSDDLTNAMKASMFTLNTKGAKRGYVPAEVQAAREEAEQAKSLTLSLAQMQEFAEWQADKLRRQNASPACPSLCPEDAHKPLSTDQSLS